MNDTLVERLLDEVDDGVYFVDRERRITFWSRGAEQLTGYQRDEILGRRCFENTLEHVDDQGRPLCLGRCPLAATIKDGEAREGQVFLRHKAGHRVPVRVRTSALRDGEQQVFGGAEVFADATPQRDLVERLRSLEQLAMVDQLTELPNRRFLDATLAKREGELRRYGWAWGALLLDIDHFKRVNDTHGHDVGDEVLRVVARALAHSARVSDVVGRWGGEEFLVVLANVDAAGLAVVAERLRMVVEASAIELRDPPGSLGVTISIGGALAAADQTAAAVIKRADQRLYEAKRGGRNRAALPALLT